MQVTYAATPTEGSPQCVYRYARYIYVGRYYSRPSPAQRVDRLIPAVAQPARLSERNGGCGNNGEALAHQPTELRHLQYLSLAIIRGVDRITDHQQPAPGLLPSVIN